MRRILNAAVRSSFRATRNFVERWNGFWFSPAESSLLGLIRALTGAMLVYTHAVWGLALGDFFGPDGWLQADAVRALQSQTARYAYSYWWWIPHEWMWPAHLAALVVLVLFMIGFWTRLTSILSFVIVVSYVHRVPSALFGLDQINAMLTLYSAIGYLTIPAVDRALSLDRLLARRKLLRRPSVQPAGEPQPRVGANLGVRLIQVHMCVIYFFAGIAKLQGTAWWDGQAMWLAFASLEYQSADMTWLADHPLIVNVMSHFTVLWEIFFCVLIWKPLWRPFMLAGAVALHIGIGACLGMWTFGLIMLVGCASFLPNSLVKTLAGALARSPAPSDELPPSTLPQHSADHLQTPELTGAETASRASD